MRAGLLLDLRLQRRHGFYYAAAFTAALWVVVLYLLPDPLIAPGMPYVIFGDLGIVGFFFIVGAMFLEQGERTLFALLPTPMRFGTYLAAKLTSLTGLALAASLMVTLARYGLGFEPVSFALGVVYTSVLMMLISFCTAALYPSISEWLMPSLIPLVIVNLPLLDYSGLWPGLWLYVIPTEAPLLLLGASFHQLELAGWRLAYALGYPILCSALLAALARRMFYRYIVAREGSS
ncbi:fluoroquinolone transport system permease protein [Pseudonocardia eucalypti]|nr:fluoroquinolone transport system permease protein [Pseudonocardia eucalypti]